MDGFEINKILGAILGTLLFTHALNIIAGGLISARTPDKPGYEIAVEETPAAGGKQVALPPAEPIEQRLASASVEKGQAAARKCLACHSFEKGGPNKVGPNLWNVIGSERASKEGFAYSSALKQMGGTWSYEDLDKFLANPKGMVKGTSMAFAGVSKPAERADIIAYLNSLSDNPKPLPKSQAASPASR